LRLRIIIFAFLLLPKLPAVAALADTTLRVAVGGSQAASIPFTVGTKKGIFAKHGLNVEIVSITNAQMSAQAQLSGSVQLATSNPTGFFYLARQGADAVGIASWNNSSPYSLASRLKIKDVSGLKGKKIGTSGAGGRSDAFIKYSFAKVGLDPRRDIEILSLTGGSAVRLAAALSGRVDATLISYTQEKQAQKLGLSVIPLPLEYVQGLITTQGPYLERNAKTVKAFLRTLGESIRAITADREGTLRIIATVLRTDDKEALDHAYNTLRIQVVPDLIPTEEAIVSVLKTMSYDDPAYESIAPFKHLDLSLVKEIKAEDAKSR
jgi:NitT/TauT family transport system substrate-binding protein